MLRKPGQTKAEIRKSRLMANLGKLGHTKAIPDKVKLTRATEGNLGQSKETTDKPRQTKENLD